MVIHGQVISMDHWTKEEHIVVQIRRQNINDYILTVMYGLFLAVVLESSNGNHRTISYTRSHKSLGDSME